MTLNICTQNDVKQLYEGKLKNIRRIHFEQGTYYFDKPVRFRRVRGLKLSGNACLTGAVPLSLEFQPFRDKIVMAKLPAQDENRCCLGGWHGISYGAVSKS